MIKELDQIVLTEDLPEYGLRAGDVGTVVLVHQEGKGYEVEFVALDGETLAVVLATGGDRFEYAHMHQCDVIR